MRACTYTLIIVTILTVLGCGVKGDPLPPEKPPELGRGRPTYKRSTQELSYPALPPAEEQQEEDESDEETEGQF